MAKQTNIDNCPHCGSERVKVTGPTFRGTLYMMAFVCKDCRCDWERPVDGVDPLVAKKESKYVATFWTCGRGDDKIDVCTFSAKDRLTAFQKTVALAKSFVSSTDLLSALEDFYGDENDCSEITLDAWQVKDCKDELDDMDVSDFYCKSLVAPDGTILYSGDQETVNYKDFG